MHSEPQLSRREREIMDVIHAKGEASAADVLAALTEPPSYSAVRALLRIMEEKGFLKHRQEGTRYIYLPGVSKANAQRSALKRVVATFFEGSVAQTMAALLEHSDTHLPESELGKLEEMIKQARKEGR